VKRGGEGSYPARAAVKGKIVKWCDLSCEQASFPKEAAVDGSGSCRTFAALYCRKLGKLVHKNGPCQDEEQQEGAGVRG
jgi:hypothetical protein